MSICEKPIEWRGSSLEDLKAFPLEAVKYFGHELHLLQHGLEPTDFKAMQNLGSGVMELRKRLPDGAFRVVYVAKFEHAVVVLHSFQKKAKPPPAAIPTSSKPVTAPCYRKSEMNDIDTAHRHTTPADGNVFADLGLDDAERLHAASIALIRNKTALMDGISEWVSANGLKQAQAAEILGISRPRVSDLLNRKTAKFTLDALVQIAAKAGKTVHLQIS